jgi:hypothetical protein
VQSMDNSGHGFGRNGGAPGTGTIVAIEVAAPAVFGVLATGA